MHRQVGMHAALTRQVQRLFPDGAPDDPRLRALIEALGEECVAADQAREQMSNRLDRVTRELEAQMEALRADIRLREALERERDAFFTVSPDLLAITDPSMRLRHFNPAWQHLLGYSPEELEGRELYEWLHPDDRARTLAAGVELRERGALIGFENRYRHKNGDWKLLRWSVISARGGLLYCVGHDVTEERSLQRELSQAQKLEAVGQLAAGVAHEINTPMQFIGDNVNFAAEGFRDLLRWVVEARPVLARGTITPAERDTLDTLARDGDLSFLVDELPRALDETRDGVRRVGELVRALKEFAHPDHVELTAADLNKALDRTLVLARGSLKHVARVETVYGDLPDVVCQVGQLNQVFLNLLVNAAHAIEDKQRRTRDTSMGDIRVVTRLDGDHVVVSVSDSGCGIPEDIRERIFEPFFTTKEVGRGSGQGLPLIRAIVVERHGGSLTLETEVDVGTTFHVRLPIAGKAAEGASRRVA